MTAPTTEGEPVAVEVRCRNCGAQLLGPHCHACGQAARNPFGRLRDAAADVFEAAFDVDGRILRTLRDLLVPGRLAINYLAGRRARYVAPIRLFVVLSVLTCFVAHWASTGGALRIDLTDMDNSEIAAATTEAELEVARQAQLALLQGKRALIAGNDGAGAAQAALDARRADIGPLGQHVRRNQRRHRVRLQLDRRPGEDRQLDRRWLVHGERPRRRRTN